jgi:alpha-1,3-rhamnosyl/mannosyltransferase
MRIAIDARYLHNHFPGIGRYVAGLLQGFAELDHRHTLLLLYHPEQLGRRFDLRELQRPGCEAVAFPLPPFHPAAHWRLPLLARRLQLDLLHSPYYLKPYAGMPCPTVVTIFDIIGRRMPGAIPRRSRLLFDLLMTLAVQRSNSIITASQHTRRDLIAAYRADPRRIAVTPLAADRRFAPRSYAECAALRRRYGLPERYLLYLGANKPHKNLLRLLQAWQLLLVAGAVAAGSVQLVIAGHHDPRYAAELQAAIPPELRETVLFLPNPAEADLPVLYSGAEIFVFPSLYEGFGLPPLEAMACGTPVVCAGSSSLPEVVGEAALLVDPYDPASIAAGMRRLLNDEQLRNRLRAAGRIRARSLSWQETARMTMQVYENVASKRT